VSKKVHAPELYLHHVKALLQANFYLHNLAQVDPDTPGESAAGQHPTLFEKEARQRREAIALLASVPQPKVEQRNQVVDVPARDDKQSYAMKTS
jgi:hypothetical protein